MLKKIVKIKSVGLFNHATCITPEFNKATLIYAENGRGKSTLASILRSCATSDAASIHIQKTFNSPSDPEIQLFFDNGTFRGQASFDGNVWSCPYPDILVFDTKFVDKNVYSGTEIDSKHRQGLLEFALGEDAVSLKQQVDSEAQKIAERAKEETTADKALALYRGGMALKKFVNLLPDEQVDEKIKLLQARLTAANNNEALQKKQCPERLVEPSLPIDKFFAVISKTLIDVEATAEETVRSHINKYSNQGFEDWLSQGQSFSDHDNCPYCGQTVSSTNLLAAYKAHFNEAYKDLKLTVANLFQGIEKRLSDSVVHELVNTVEKNQLISNEWIEYTSQQKFELDSNILLKIFGQLHDLFYKLALAKQNNPLESVGSDEDKSLSSDLWNQVLIEIRKCNQSISVSMDEIASFKNKLSSENIQQLQQELDQLQLVRTRQEASVSSLIQQWRDAKSAKKNHEQLKATARLALDNLMTETLEQYQDKINLLMKKFGVLFEIDGLRPDYLGTGLPRSNYGLKVKGHNVKLSSDSQPSFATALSEGDKRTLAFAFFIARVEADANLSNKIIVVDDPVCSLDRSRRNHTKRILRDIGMKSAQLIVLGHDPHFLRDLRDDFKDKNVNIPTQLLKITRVPSDYSDFSSSFNVDIDCASDYYRDYTLIHDFIDGKPVQDIRNVARAIRPLLEGYLHRRFPRYIERSKLFGEIIGQVKQAQLPNPLFYLKPLATEFYEVNEYAGDFHHNTNPDADTVYIEESELRSYAERALTIVHKGTN
jgi:wobble nucleotide-excising tRNase